MGSVSSGIGSSDSLRRVLAFLDLEILLGLVLKKRRARSLDGRFEEHMLGSFFAPGSRRSAAQAANTSAGGFTGRAGKDGLGLRR